MSLESDAARSFREREEFRLAKYTDFALNEFVNVIREYLADKRWGPIDEHKARITAIKRTRKRHITYRTQVYDRYKHHVDGLAGVLGHERDEGEARARYAITWACRMMNCDPMIFRPTVKLNVNQLQLSEEVEVSSGSIYDNPVPGPSGMQSRQPADASFDLFKVPAVPVERGSDGCQWPVLSAFPASQREALKRAYDFIEDGEPSEEVSNPSTFDTNGLFDDWGPVSLD